MTATPSSPGSSDKLAPLREGRGRIGFPAYRWRVWVGWIALTVFVVAPIGALVGYLIGDVSDGGFGQAVGAGIWICVLAATAGYFEFVNRRLRRSSGLSQKSQGVGLAVAALVVGIVFLLIGGPLALVLAFLAWRKVRKAGTFVAAGAPTTAVAFLVGAVDTIYLLLVLTGVLR